MFLYASYIHARPLNEVQGCNTALCFSTRSHSMLLSRMSDWDGKEEVLGSFGEGQPSKSLNIADVAMDISTGCIHAMV